VTTLDARALLAVGLVAVVTGALLFGIAGTLRYWQAWVFLCVFFGASLSVTLYLMRRDPALLARRMHGGPMAEKDPVQRVIMWLASLGFTVLLVVPALDHRFGWSSVPLAGVVAGDLLIVIGLALVFRVYRENSFGAATIQVMPGQTVVTTGPYAVVRHPMYASALVYVVGTPLALGSYWGLAGLALMAPALVWRLLAEEALLARELPGYREYQRRVRYRLIPLVW
jgi:protein-S-isoprenylcysteine O-methyltransferase Ste14